MDRLISSTGSISNVDNKDEFFKLIDKRGEKYGIVALKEIIYECITDMEQHKSEMGNDMLDELVESMIAIKIVKYFREHGHIDSHLHDCRQCGARRTCLDRSCA